MKIEDPDDVEAANDVTVTSLARRKRRHVAPRVDAPTIKVDAGTGAAARVVDQSESALIAARRGLYQRDGKIVHVADSPVVTAGKKKIVAQRILEVGDHALLEELGSSAKFTKYDVRGKEDVAIYPPLWVVKTLRQRVGRFRFDILTGIISAPNSARRWFPSLGAGLRRGNRDPI